MNSRTFGTPWRRDPLLDLSYLLDRPSRYRSSRLHSPSSVPATTYHTPRSHHEHSYPLAYGQPRSVDLDRSSSPDYSPSEHGEQHILDTDDNTDEYQLPHIPPQRQQHSRRASEAPPGVSRVSLTLPSETADQLSRDEILILPALTHLHIRIRTGNSQHLLRAAVVGSTKLRDMVAQILPPHCSDSVEQLGIRVFVRQRGRWEEHALSSSFGGIALRREGSGGGRMQVDVEIEVGGDRDVVRGHGYVGGRGAGSGGVEERVRERDAKGFRDV